MSSVVLQRKRNPEAFWRGWEELAAGLGAGPRALRSSVEWALEIAEERGLEDDFSFVMERDGRPVAAALLPVGRVDGAPAVTLSGGYVPAPLVADASLRKTVYRLIDETAGAAGLGKALFMIDPLAGEPYNHLQAFGYLDTSILSHVIDLTRSGALLPQCRHGHAYDIKRTINNSRCAVVRVDAERPDRAHHEAYERLHEKCSGRKTRSTRTFDRQYEQLLAGEAVLFGLLIDGASAAYAYFQHAGDKASYASAADDPDVKGIPLYHRLIYAAMEHYRERGVKAIDTCEPSSPSSQLDYAPDGKQLNIAKFKRGFAGSYRPFYRGIRHYDPRLALTDMEKFSKTYASSLKTAALTEAS